MSDEDKIIRFPGASAPAPETAKPKTGRTARKPTPPPTAPAGLEGLSEDQRKALQVVMSGMPFVLVGIQPTERGADFFTSLHGEAADLRNAQPHLAGVIDRLFARRGI